MHIFHKSFVKHLTILAIRNFGETEIFFFPILFLVLYLLNLLDQIISEQYNLLQSAFNQINSKISKKD